MNAALKRSLCVMTLAASLAALLTACDKTEANKPLSGDPVRGRIALTQYACHACHVIPGITGSDIYVGPPLAGIASRQMIAGEIPNTPENLMAWIQHPKAMDPATAMPDMGVQADHARDMVAYLSTLK